MIFKAWPLDRTVSQEINFHVPTAFSRMLSAAVEAGIEIAKAKPRPAMAPSVSERCVFIGVLQLIGSVAATAVIKTRRRNGAVRIMPSLFFHVDNENPRDHMIANLRGLFGSLIHLFASPAWDRGRPNELQFVSREADSAFPICPFNVWEKSAID